MLSDYNVSKVAGTPVTFEVIRDGLVVNTQTVVLEADGGYQFETSAEGDVELRVKALHWLAKRVSASLPLSEAADITLLNGDVNNDNKVNVLDYFTLKANYNQVGVGDHPADLNGDGNINVLDFFVLKKNYNTIGE